MVEVVLDAMLRDTSRQIKQGLPPRISHVELTPEQRAALSSEDHIAVAILEKVAKKGRKSGFSGVSYDFVGQDEPTK